jgi:tRNA wybutosine-synthesizing protein 1
MDKAEEFVSHVKRMQPDVIECKGYMHVGYSMKRLSRDNMPSFAEVRNFAEQLANLAGYDFRDEVQESSVILLSRPGYDK